MELLHLPNAKLLYTIAVLHKDKAITSEENLYLKDNPSEAELKSRLLAIVKKGETTAPEEKEAPAAPKQVFPKDVMNSPLDTYLFDARRKALVEQKEKEDAAPGEAASRSNLGGLLANNINPCNYGQSPVMQKSDLIRKEMIGFLPEDN